MLKIMAELHWNGLKGLLWTLAFVIAVGGTLYILASLLGV